MAQPCILQAELHKLRTDKPGLRHAGLLFKPTTILMIVEQTNFSQVMTNDTSDTSNRKRAWPGSVISQS